MFSIHKLIGLGELDEQGFRAKLSFWLICLLTFFLFGDQNLIAPNLKNIASSLGISEQKDIDWYLGGLIPIFFFILGGFVSVSMGYLSQSFTRKSLLIASVLLGEIPCFLTAYSNSYTEFFIYRVLCGFGLGGLFPLLFSLVGDYFSVKSRVTATAYVSLSMGLGVGVGQLVGGIFGSQDVLNGWRTSFILMSVPSFLFVFIYAIFCPEPKRGRSEEFQSSDELNHKLSFEDIKLILKKKTNLSIMLQGVPGCVPWSVFFVFLVDYYEQMYLINKLEASGLVTFLAVGIFLGTFIGGVVGQKLYNKNPIYQPIFVMLSIFFGLFPCMFLLFSKEIINTPYFLLLNIFAGTIISLPISNVRSILITVNQPKERSSIFAVYNLFDDLGRGLGPAFSAILLTILPERSTALAVSILFWVPCAVFWLPAIFNFKREEIEAKENLKKELAGL
jgi:MFS family permease